MQRQQYNQTEFIDREGTKFMFTNVRLTATLSEKRRKWIEEKNVSKPGKINLEEALKEAYITPSQVISFDYSLQKELGCILLSTIKRVTAASHLHLCKSLMRTRRSPLPIHFSCG
jgi:hypothetical protein